MDIALLVWLSILTIVFVLFSMLMLACIGWLVNDMEVLEKRIMNILKHKESDDGTD